MITKRDQDIINFLDEFNVATSKHLQTMFFNRTNYRYCMQRLQYLSDGLFIKRTRSTIDNCFAYYLDRRPAQIHHDLIRSQLYTAIMNKYDVLEWHNEFTIEHIRPDAMCYIKHFGVVFPVLVEIHLNNKFNFDKYKFDFIPIFGVNPRVIICTDREVKVPISAIRFKVVGVDMSGLDTLFK